MPEYKLFLVISIFLCSCDRDKSQSIPEDKYDLTEDNQEEFRIYSHNGMDMKYSKIFKKKSEVNVWGQLDLIKGDKIFNIEKGQGVAITDFGQVGWSKDNVFIYKIIVGEINEDLADNISKRYYTAHIHYDAEFNYSGIILFTRDLNCYLSSGDIIRCLDEEQINVEDNNMVLIRDLIFNDIQRIINNKTELNHKRINRYFSIYKDNFDSGSYQVLFKYLFDTYDKYSKKESVLINTSNINYSQIKTINFLFLQDQKDAEYYNNFAYYLEQSGAYQEAIFLLEEVIEKFPSRTVAYINLGDAYWGLGEQEKARTAYRIYTYQMQEKGKAGRIPDVVLERVKE
ncbi:MAG: tetratricopeptide repeat protein [Bacteroidota bacterium]